MPSPEKSHLDEMKEIRAAAGGILRRQDVVQFARDPATALHSHFEWDDRAGAEQYRLLQAGKMIRGFVTIIAGSNVLVRGYVSLMPDRLNGGGYRPIEAVLKSKSMRAQLIEGAFRDFAIMRRKYEQIQALEPVWTAMEKVAKKLGVALAQQPVKKTG